MKRRVIKNKWFEYRRFYSDVKGYIDVATLDQADNPNMLAKSTYNLNSFRTWVRTNNTMWQCLVTQRWMDNIYLLEGFSANEVFELIVKDNVRN